MYTINKLYYVACAQDSPCGTNVDDPDIGYILIRFKGENPDIETEPLYPLLFENVKMLDKRKKSLPYTGLGTSTYFENGNYYDISCMGYPDNFENGIVKELPLKVLK